MATNQLDDFDQAWADRILAMTPDQIRKADDFLFDFRGAGEVLAHVMERTREQACAEAVARAEVAEEAFNCLASTEPRYQQWFVELVRHVHGALGMHLGREA